MSWLPVPPLQSPTVEALHHAETGTITYIVTDPSTGRCAVIDPVLDFDIVAGCISYASLDALITHLHDTERTLEWVLETHVHADHLSGADYLRERLCSPIAIGASVRAVQRHWLPLFDSDVSLDAAPVAFDRLLEDGDQLTIGTLDVKVLCTPGHTPACVAYVIGSCVFVGDTLFMPDAGTARCDFPGGAADTLFASIQRILALPDAYHVFTAHDYGPSGRAIECVSTVAEQRALNIHVGAGATRESFVACRTQRDATLSLPKLMIPALQVNLRAGRAPAAKRRAMMSITTMSIERIDTSLRYAQAVVHGGTVYLAGQIADSRDAGIEQQATEIFARIDAILHKAGTTRSRLLTLQVWLADFADYAAFNAVYDAWIDPAAKPARACVRSELLDPRLKVEISAVAARD